MLIELVLPLVVWTGMGICEIILSTLVIVAIAIKKSCAMFSTSLLQI